MTRAPGTRIPELDRSGLRNFGLTMAAIITALFGLVLPVVFGRNWPTWPWLLAAALAMVSLLVPAALRPVYRGWMRIGMLLNRVMTPVILGVLFFLVFTPVSLAMKLIGRDALRRKLAPEDESYRIDARDRPPSDMERPF